MKLCDLLGKNLKNADVRCILLSNLFDGRWYKKQYPEVKTSGLNAAAHYTNIGWKKGYNPSEKFDGNSYLQRNPDVLEANVNPLLHYIRYGKKEGRKLYAVGREKKFWDCCLEFWLNKQLQQYNIKDGILQHNGMQTEYQPAFSLIMATYNRKSLISEAIDSLLAQTYQNFELLIVDDGSTDNTADFIATHYAKELQNGRIKYIYQPHQGESKARNTGLSQAANTWIAYLDCDTKLKENFLAEFAKYITICKKHRIFYAKTEYKNSGAVCGYYFDLNILKQTNYINLGVFVHHISLFDKFGGFEEKMSRLADWELITRYCQFFNPLFINKVLLEYNDNQSYQRISNFSDFNENMNFYRNRYGN